MVKKKVAGSKPAKPMAKAGPKAERHLALKIVQAGGASSHGFVWPLVVGATVTAPDWKPTKECGHGLHAWKDGEGDVSACAYHADEGCIGLVVDYDPADCVDLGDKIKVRECVILFVGTVREAAAWISAKRPTARVIYGQASAGDSGSAVAGYSGSAVAGYSGSAVAGYSGSAVAGDRGSAVAGDSGSAVAGYSGSAVAGDSGSAVAGYSGSAVAGYRGSAVAGYRGSAVAGPYGTLSILYYDRSISVYRRKIAECDPNGPIKPWRRYTLSDAGEWVEGAEVPEGERPAALLAAAYAAAKAKK
jgi:hypothetical protein